jgi:hypothetical protein
MINQNEKDLRRPEIELGQPIHSPTLYVLS